jgi:hypothetical protein
LVARASTAASYSKATSGNAARTNAFDRMSGPRFFLVERGHTTPLAAKIEARYGCSSALIALRSLIAR